MQTVFERGGEGRGLAAGQCGDEQSAPLDVENGIVAGIGGRQNAPGVGRWHNEIGHNYRDAVVRVKLHAHGSGDARRIDGARDYRSQRAGRDVVGVALDIRRLVQDPLGIPVEIENVARDHDSRGQRGCTRSQALADRNFVRYFHLEGGHFRCRIGRDSQGGFPDQIFAIGWDQMSVAPAGADGERRRGTETANEVQVERQGQRVEAGSQVGA